ncbi:MAG: DoxX family protein [Bacteroidales bacterium]|nr:DoxX family protein [Bacteroidales bacterium]
MRNRDLSLLVIRLTIGILMLLHGIYKLNHGIGGIVGAVEAKGLPGFIGYGVFIGEVIAPLLIIIGYRTRVGALLLLTNMLFVIFLIFQHSIFSLGPQGGWKLELVGFYLFGAVALFFSGGGKYALSSKSSWD